MTRSTLRREISRCLLLLVVTSVVHVIFRIDRWGRPMVGDDFLGIRVTQMPIRDGSFLQNIWLVGGGKWRPVTTSLLLFLGQKWGYSYQSFQIFNSVLLVLVATITGVICLRLTSKFFPAALTSAAIIASQFNWMAQISIYGSMELLAILFLLASVATLALPRFDSFHPQTRTNLSVLLLLLSTFCHERYVVCSIVFVGFLLLRQRRMGSTVGSWKPLIVPTTHIVIKAFVLNLDPLTGGGESNFRQSGGLWIAAHYVDAVKMLFGWFSGAGHFYSGDELGKLAQVEKFGLTGFAITVTALLVSITFAALNTRSRIRCVDTRRTLELSLLMICLSFVCLVPAAFVIQRIEARWIFASQILLLLASTTCVCAVTKKHVATVASLLPAAFLGIALAYLPGTDSFTILWDQPATVLEELSELAPTTGPWSLVITQNDPNVSTAWQFGYGDALSQLPNPPYFANISQDPLASCVSEHHAMPCLRVRLHGFDIVGDVERDEVPFTASRR